MASAAANWSDNTAPTDGDSVVFNATSQKDCIWDLDIQVQNWIQEDTYTGWITIRTKFPGAGSFTNLRIQGDCAISNGFWTHPANTGGTNATDRLAVTVAGNFTLDGPAVISVTGRGYAAATGPGAGNVIQRASSYGRGGSHGGMGAYSAGVYPADCYGSMTVPETLGSGAYGPGGGAVRLDVAGTATINGTIDARGRFTSTLQTGAAGGSIFLKAAVVSGTGVMNASGADGFWSGGGGRIAVRVTNAASLGNVVCRALPGVPSGVRGAAGTIYQEVLGDEPGHGRLIVDHQNLRPMAGAYTQIPAAKEDPVPMTTLTGELANVTLVITNGGAIWTPWSVRLGDFAWLGAGGTQDLNGCTLFIRAPAPPLPFPANYGSGSVLSNGGRILWGDPAATLRLAITNGPNGEVSQAPAVADGYYPYGTPATLSAVPAPGCAFLWWTGDVPEGSNRTANPLTVPMNRERSLRGLFASSAPGVRTWTGDGTNPAANVASNWYPAQTPVSGDHIRFDATSTRECAWNLDIVPGSWTQTAGYAASYTLRDGFNGWVLFRTVYPGQGTLTNVRIAGPVLLEAGTWTHPTNTGGATARDRLCITVDGDFTLAGPASLDVSARGYAAATGPGAGNTLQRDGAAGKGASHGGRGAYGSTATAAPCYGSVTAPESLGSGAWGGPGGGAIRLQIGGHAQLDGVLLADAPDLTTQNPGGAGGSIWLTAASLSGTGTISAQGANGYQSGGGGRLACHLTVSNDFGGIVWMAAGGPGSSSPNWRGAAGTIYLRGETPPMYRGSLIVNNANLTNANALGTNWFTELPPTLDADPASLAFAALVVTNRGRVVLTDTLTMGDLRHVGPDSLLFLKGYDLILHAFEHPFGASGTVAFEDGKILWLFRGGTFIKAR